MGLFGRKKDNNTDLNVSNSATKPVDEGSSSVAPVAQTDDLQALMNEFKDISRDSVPSSYEEPVESSNLQQNPDVQPISSDAAVSTQSVDPIEDGKAYETTPEDSRQIETFLQRDNASQPMAPPQNNNYDSADIVEDEIVEDEVVEDDNSEEDEIIEEDEPEEDEIIDEGESDEEEIIDIGDSDEEILDEDEEVIDEDEEIIDEDEEVLDEDQEILDEDEEFIEEDEEPEEEVVDKKRKSKKTSNELSDEEMEFYKKLIAKYASEHLDEKKKTSATKTKKSSTKKATSKTADTKKKSVKSSAGKSKKIEKEKEAEEDIVVIEGAKFRGEIVTFTPLNEIKKASWEDVVRRKGHYAYHVTSASNGGWFIKRSGSPNPYAYAKRKDEVMRLARIYAEREKAELKIHNEKGVIEKSFSFGREKLRG